MRKYGIEHFHIELLEETDNPEEREIYWIEKMRSFKYGYNATYGGDGKKYIDDEKLRKDLVRYQNFVVKDINVSEKVFDGEYDWKNYFQSILVDDIHPALEKRNVRYSVKDDRVTHSWPEYAEKVLWFGRRGGKNIYTSEIHEEKI